MKVFIWKVHLVSILVLLTPASREALSYGHDFFAEGEVLPASAGVNVRNCYPNNFLKLCLGSGLSIGYALYFRDFPSNPSDARSPFYETLGMNAFISRDFWRVRIDFGLRLGLDYSTIFNKPDKQYFYGMQIRLHWALVKDKVYVGTIVLYGATESPSANRFNAYSGSDSKTTFALIPVSFIYVF